MVGDGGDARLWFVFGVMGDIASEAGRSRSRPDVFERAVVYGSDRDCDLATPSILNFAVTCAYSFDDRSGTPID